MAFITTFPGVSVRVHSPQSAITAAPMYMSAAPTRRAFLESGVAAAAAVFSLSVCTPALADQTMATKRRSYDRYFPRIEAGIPLIAGIGTAIKAGNLPLAKSLAADKLVDIKLRRSLGIYATSFSDSSITVQSQELLAATAGFFENLNLAVNAKSQDEAVAKFNLAADAYMAYIRVARLSKLYSAEFAISM
jgi:hypothetical protein